MQKPRTPYERPWWVVSDARPAGATGGEGFCQGHETKELVTADAADRTRRAQEMGLRATYRAVPRPQA